MLPDPPALPDLPVPLDPLARTALLDLPALPDLPALTAL